MAGKKKPKELHGIRTTFRITQAKIDELDKYSEEWKFNSRTALIKWCLDLGVSIFSESPPDEILRMIEQIEAQRNVQVREDPRQMKFRLETQAIARQQVAEAYEKIEAVAETLTQ
jgi:hypothetical protein